jgi:signal peptidase II
VAEPHRDRERGFDRRLAWVLAAFVGPAVALDQATKWCAERWLTPGEPVPVVPGFIDLVLSYNAGAFYSLGADLDESLRRPLFLVLTLLAIALLLRLYFRGRDATERLRLSLLFFVAGAVGNLADRAIHGEVVDFIHVHLRDHWRWATFNVADVFISAGLVLLLADLLGRKKPAVDERRRID